MTNTNDTGDTAPKPPRQRSQQRSKLVEELNALGIDGRELQGVVGWQMRFWAVVYVLLGAVVAGLALWGFIYSWLIGHNFLGGVVMLLGVGVVGWLFLYSGLKTWKIFGGMKK
jgi:hypothetical protein